HYTPSAEPTTDTETTAKRLTPKISPKKSSHHRFSGRPDELGLGVGREHSNTPVCWDWDDHLVEPGRFALPGSTHFQTIINSAEKPRRAVLVNLSG
ncbi:MAG: hypothetical protein AB7I48_13875, partial [Planctomycetaceae bacterium]